MNLAHDLQDTLVYLPLGRVPWVLALLLGALPATAQQQEWARQLGTSAFESAKSAATDGSGGVFVSGETGGSLAGPSAGAWDAWIARYDASGTQLWILQFGTPENEFVSAAAPDGAGGVYVGGATLGDLGGPSAGDRDAWLAHYDGAGNQLWIRQFGTVGSEALPAVAPDGAGGVYVGGDTSGDLGGPSAGDRDAWISHYDSAGNQLWIRQLGTIGTDAAAAAAADGAGGVYFGGFTARDLGGPSAGQTDAWLARYDSAGNQLWIRQFGTRQEDGLYAAALDAAGGVYVGGQTWGALGGPLVGATDAWLARYDGAGNRLWIHQLGSSQHDAAYAASPDGAGGLYMGGLTYGALVRPPVGQGDAWLARYDGAGNQLWIRQFGTRFYTGLLAASPDPAGGVYVAGETVGNLGGPFAGDTDGWVARWQPFGCGLASAAMRNAGPNPQSLLANAPVLGGTFTATVDLTTTGHGMALLFAYDGWGDITLSGGQRVLISDYFGSGLLFRAIQTGPLATFVVPVPNDAILCGFPLSIQAMHFGTVRPFALSNAQDLVLGN